MSIRSLRAMPLLLLLLGPAAHAADGPACRYVPVATLQLRAAGDAWQPTVDGMINGKPAVMLFDTGAHASRLLKDSAEKFGLSLLQARGYSSGIGGTSANYVAEVKDFSVGDAHSGKVRMSVLGNMGRRMPFDAIIGADFALQMDLELSLAEGKIKFYRATGCDDTFLAYWSADAMEIPFGGTDTGHPNPRIIVEVNGTKMEAMIDTGASGTGMTRAAAERAGIRVGDPNVHKLGSSVGVGDKHIDTWQVEADFTIGSETIRNANLGILDNAPQGVTVGMPDVLIGADFLRAHRVLISMSQRRVYVSYLGGEVFRKRRIQ
jgi:predicted aspartyl protease